MGKLYHLTVCIRAILLKKVEGEIMAFFFLSGVVKSPSRGCGKQHFLSEGGLKKRCGMGGEFLEKCPKGVKWVKKAVRGR